MLKCLDISNYDLYWIKKIKFKISKVFTLLGCKDVGIRKSEMYGKDSIPLTFSFC